MSVIDKWEYTIFHIIKQGPDSLKSWLNSMGEYGWEAIQVVYYSDYLLVYLKRKINETKQSTAVL